METLRELNKNNGQVAVKSPVMRVIFFTPFMAYFLWNGFSYVLDAIENLLTIFHIMRCKNPLDFCVDRNFI